MSIQCGCCGAALGHIDDACPFCLPNFYRPAPSEPQPATPPAAAGERLDKIAREAWHRAYSVWHMNNCLSGPTEAHSQAIAIIRRALDAAREEGQ